MLRAERLLPRCQAFDTPLQCKAFPPCTASLLPGALALTRTGLTPAGEHELARDRRSSDPHLLSGVPLSGHANRGLAPATVRRAASVLHAALKDAVRRGQIVRNPMDSTTPPAVPKYQPTVLSEEQVLAYLADARETATPALYALYCTAATTGMRIGELLGLPETAVDLAARTLRVERTLVAAGRTPVFGDPKTPSSRRTVLLPEIAVDAIRAALRWKREQRLRLGEAFHGSGLLFCGPRGRPIFLSNLHRRDHRRRLARLNLPATRIHDLRHFHATFLVANGVDPRAAADRLGHSNPSFMLKTYAHSVARAQERSAALANELLTRSAAGGR